MSVAAVNGHVLLPHRASYAAPVRWQRSWTSKVAQTVTGAEQRAAMRTWPRHQVSWTFQPPEIEEGNYLLERLREARKSGYAAAPMFGFGIELAEHTAGDSFTLGVSPIQIYEDDYLILFGAEFDSWQVVQVDEIVGRTVTVSEHLEEAHGPGEMIWMLLFGAFECDELPSINGELYSVSCTLREIAPRPGIIIAGSDLCRSALAGVGAGDRFDCYADENPLVSELGSGNGWSAPWVIVHINGLCAWEPWDTYPDTESPSGLTGGVGLLGAWVFYDVPQTVRARETFEDYDDEDPVEDSLDEGTGFEGEWVILDVD